MAGGAVVLPTPPVGARTSWTQREGTSPSTSLCALHLRCSSLPRSSFFAWDARTHLGCPSLRLLISSTDCLLASKRISRRLVHASLLGVGAPEALVIVVVALLVFGPKGLAEVARTLGKSLRAFQPTIRELQEVSSDLRNMIDRELGLDEIQKVLDERPPTMSKTKQQSQASTAAQSESVKSKAYSAEDYARVTEEQARALVPEEQRKAAEAAAWGGSAPNVKTQTEEPVQQSDEVTNNAGHSQ
ncbi:hypothetical protein L7F22_041532 [Adiantum nelumboides]|nr:hypothetical protein [Adiantum nelumboides]